MIVMIAKIMQVKINLFVAIHMKIIAILSLACCPTIDVVIGDDVRNILGGESEGVYSYNGTFNGRDYWVKVGKDTVLWYVPQLAGWVISPKTNNTQWSNGAIYLNYDSICPKNSKNYWAFHGNTWISTIDVQLNCIGNYIYC